MELNLDLESFLALEKKRLQVEKQSLSARATALVRPNNINSYQNEEKDDDADECPAVKAIKNKEYINEIKCNRSNKTALDKCLIQQVFADEAHTRVNDLPPRPPPTATMSSALVSSAIRTTNTGSSIVTKTKTTGIIAARVQELTSPNELENSFTDMPVVEMLDCFQTFTNDLELENTSSARGLSSRSDETNVGENVSKHHADKGWSKTQKDLANSKEVKSATNVAGAEQQQLTSRSGRLRKSENKDDMEQWVSDTFYSYFPGFNNEFQKRQNLVRERQQEYQQNLLKHQNQQQMLKTAKSKEDANAAGRSSHQSMSTDPSTARSCSTTATNNTSSTNKTDLEIIVNNPNYAPKYSVSVVATSAAAAAAPPGSSRRKLLQDLQHTDLENIIAGDGVSERNRQSAEIELARKKDYQRDLMLQIEEKRRSIEALRVEDRRQDEAITRRLQEQLKTIHLEEELEKEKLRAEKLRFNTEQKRLMREHLLAKLENDDRLLNEQKATKRSEIQGSDPSKKPSLQSNNNDNADDDRNNNRVYKYFSNSARHEYRRGEPLLNNLELDLELPESPQQLGIERECFHLSEKVCPKCGQPLKNYEASCLRCQRKVSFKLKRNEGASAELHVSAAASDDHGDCDDCDEHHDDHANIAPDTVVNRRSYSLVCSKCERLYSLCPSCVIKSDVCRTCHRQRNVCMSCRRSLCSFCLEEIACGRDTERCHINDQPEDELVDNVNKVYSSRKMNDSGGGIQESAFQVLELNYAAPKTNHDGVETTNDNINRYNRNNNNNNNNSNNSNKNYNKNNNNYYYQHHQHDKISNKVPPYSLNIEKNSIFHPSHESSSSVFEHVPKIVDKNLTFDFDSSLHTDQNSNLERVRKETERRLSRYLKNYGDLTKYNIEKGIANGKSIPNISTKNHRRLQHHHRSNSESHDRGTQTTPSSVARRDVVLYEEHNLSMPLLREMPRMTRQEAQKQLRKQAPSTSNNKGSSSMMDKLKSRWEIPAVQKYSISTSPPVLTQVGAMRKQLQADRLLSEDY